MFPIFSSHCNVALQRAAFYAKSALVCGWVLSTAHADEPNLEYKIKAAYLYNFTKFITWPNNPGPSFNICLIGDNPFGNLLDTLETKTVADKPIRLRHLDSLKQAQDCQILYAEKTEQRIDVNLTGVLLVGNLGKTLTVSSQPFFAESGGMIGFVLDDEKVRLHINLKALKQSGLSISAKLIEVATLVEGGGRE
ncbi:YfiR family protein [Methylococcaceae bacterium WWC4]|nr:YfiR family protein [Methylococcaceae bacterium WWC4]OHX38370.1 hypothetical protein BJL95_08680 [Methylomonas sp. LWB]